MLVGNRIFPEKCSDCQYRGLRTFCNLGTLALRRFEEIGSPVSLPGHAVLFREGQLCNTVFVVCTGQLKLTTTSKDGRTLILRLAVPGDVLGLSATLGDMPYEVTAETVEPTILRSIRKPDFLSFLAVFSEVGEKTSTRLPVSTMPSISTPAGWPSPALQQAGLPSYCSIGPIPPPVAGPTSASPWRSPTKNSPAWPAPRARLSPAC